MSEGDFDSSRSRRPRLEGRTIYRPGSGPLKKSSSNVENIQPSGSSNLAPSVEASTPSKRDVIVNNDRGEGSSRSSTNNGPPPPGKPKKYSNHRAEREIYKPKSEGNSQQRPVNEQRSDHAHDRPPASSSGSQGAKQKVPTANRMDTEQAPPDLRQLILEKRAQRGINHSPSGSNRDRSNTSQPRSQQQSATSNAPAGRQANDSSGFSRNGDRRGSGKRRNDRKQNNHPRVENSQSDGHLSAHINSSNNSSAPVTQQHQPVRSTKSNDPTAEKNTGPAPDLERNRNGRDRRDGKQLSLYSIRN